LIVERDAKIDQIDDHSKGIGRNKINHEKKPEQDKNAKIQKEDSSV
jgi:hypothetical protein